MEEEADRIQTLHLTALMAFDPDERRDAIRSLASFRALNELEDVAETSTDIKDRRLAMYHAKRIREKHV